MDLVVRGAGEEVLQGAPDLLRQAVHERGEQAGLVVLGQVRGELLLLRLLVGKAVLARNQLRELRAAEGLVAVVEHLVVAQDLQAGRVRTDFEQGHERILALVGQCRHHAAHRQTRGVGLDVEHAGLEARRLGQALAVLHPVAARRRDQDLDVSHRGRARTDHAEVQTDLVERKRDVLVGLGLDLQLELLLAQPGRQHDLLGDHGRLRHRHDHLSGAGAAFGHHPLDRFGDFVELLDLAVRDPPFFEAFRAEALHDVLAGVGLAQLHELDAR